jgi:cytochrome c biogenesis protein CcmG, thiol:disulfide interchange protein DsbE
LLKRPRLYLNVLVAAGGLALVVALLMVLQRSGTQPAPAEDPSPPPPPPSATPIHPSTDTVAVVDSDPILRAEWQKAVVLDRAMSQLAGQPVPSIEATLDRLVNGRLVLHQTGFKITASDSDASARLALLQQGWRADDAVVDRALASAGLTRQDLLAEVKRLLVVEAYLGQVASSQNPAAWLAAQRAQAQIGIYADLTAPVAQASAPVPVARAATPTPAQPASARVTTAGSAPGQLAPDFSLDDINGQRVKLSDLRGHPVIVNFWATWCPPCRQEAPAIQAAYQRYRDQGVILLGVNLREDAQTIQQFAKEFGLTYPLLLDRDGAVSDRYQVRGIPTTVFVDADGVVRARHVGPLTEDKLVEYLAPLFPEGGLGLASPASTPMTTTRAKTAPDFSLPREDGQTIRLNDYRDKSSAVLVFYRGQT